MESPDPFVYVYCTYSCIRILIINFKTNLGIVLLGKHLGTQHFIKILVNILTISALHFDVYKILQIWYKALSDISGYWLCV